MGIVCFKNLEEVPTLQRLCYDMSSVLLQKPAIIWFVGPQGSGRTTQAEALCEKLDLQPIPVAQLLREEYTKDTDRSKMIRDAFKGRTKKVMDEIVIDLIKECMIVSPKVGNCNGYLINNFPKTQKQARLFIKEICDVDVILYLFTEIDVLIKRTVAKNEKVDPDAIKRNVIDYMKEVLESCKGYGAKLEKVYTNSPANIVYKHLESAIQARLNIKFSRTDMLDDFKLKTSIEMDSSTKLPALPKS